MAFAFCIAGSDVVVDLSHAVIASGIAAIFILLQRQNSRK